MKKRGRLGVRLDERLLDRFRNALAAHRYRMAHVLDELIEGWVLEQESKPYIWTDREGRIKTKQAGEPFPDLLEGGRLPTGRPLER